MNTQDYVVIETLHYKNIHEETFEYAISQFVLRVTVPVLGWPLYSLAFLDSRM